MRSLSIICVAVTTLVLNGPAPAVVISSWSFEGLTVSNTAGVAPVPTAGNLTSDTGNGTFTGVHAANTTWSTPVGNGSTKSLSSNTWTANDLWEFTSDTTGFVGVQLVFDAARSSTGPADFKVQYSLTGPAGTFLDLPGGAYTLGTVSFSSAGSPNANTPPRFFFDLGGIAALDNNPNAAFRLVTTSGGTATGGTSRIDNVTVGTNIIPEPAAALLLIAPLLVRRRRPTA